MTAALGDAAWMAAMERNSDLVKMQCYAPLFVRVDPGARQWRPDLIGFDSLTSYGSPSYYAFKMFSRNVGDEILKASLDDATLHCSVTKDSKSGAILIKLVNPQPTPQPLHLNIQGATSLKSTGTATTLAGAADANNSIDNPTNVAPVTAEIPGVKPEFDYTLPADSVTVLELNSQ
jgi:alpha-N-arabinofuranosidase